MTDLAFIAVGGAVGAVSRYAVVSASASVAGDFPYGTLAVNVAGALLMGLIVEGAALGIDLPENVRLALVVGVLGGFTTFSAFALDAYTLYEEGRMSAAVLYVAASTLLSIGALALGITIARTVARVGI